VYQKRSKRLEYYVMEEGIRGRILGMRKEIHAVSLREENPMQ
jgi:hypothetical protein